MMITIEIYGAVMMSSGFTSYIVDDTRALEMRNV